MPVLWRHPSRGGLTPEEEAEKAAWMAGVHPLQRDWPAERRVPAYPEGQVRSLPEQEIEFRPHRRPRYEVQLTYETRRAIEREIRAEAPRGLETGGLLYSLYPPGRDRLLVSYATGPAHNSRHSRHSVVIGSIAAVEAGLPDFIRRQGMLCVGTFHTHPSFDAEPSATDRRSWVSMLCRAQPSFIGVIATRDPDGHGWSFPQLHAWLCYRDEDGVAVIEPARIID
jgi:hypothetical protein